MESSFDQFWNTYDNKKSRDKCERKWNLMGAKEQQACMDSLPAYIKSTPERQYRKHPATYLNQKCWNDKIYSKDGDTPMLYKVPDQPRISQEPARAFDPQLGLQNIKDKLQRNFETGVDINDFGSVYTNRLNGLIDVPELIKKNIRDKVVIEAGTPRKNRFEPEVNINIEYEVRTRILNHFLDICRAKNVRIWEKI